MHANIDLILRSPPSSTENILNMRKETAQKNKCFLVYFVLMC